jgi:hypothetical protein
MSRNTKVILAVFMGIVVLILMCAGTMVISLGGLAWNGMAQAMEFDAEQVSEQAASIANFELPAGYRPGYAFNAGGFRMVGYDMGDNHSHLILVQSPTWLKLDQMALEKELRRQFGDKVDWGDEKGSKLVDRRTLHVAGQPVEFAISEGVNSEGGSYRSMVGVWGSPSGQVLINVVEPAAHWNQAEVDAFIASIH